MPSGSYKDGKAKQRRKAKFRGAKSSNVKENTKADPAADLTNGCSMIAFLIVLGLAIDVKWLRH